MEMIGKEKRVALANKINIIIDVKVDERKTQEELKTIMDLYVKEYKEPDVHVMVRVYDYKTFPNARDLGVVLWVGLADANFATYGKNTETLYFYHVTDDDYSKLLGFYNEMKREMDT